ncbi:ammonium transporter [Succinivibrio dextrinosolvens]|uniref:ammonium transporter n=1 Tax=Succinivibrio dextrinosolvens TaxID=83771 RepID=UPI0004E15B5D|nr:ammonium transporter [Succinivibrio dextrinosolvens]
MKRSLKICTVLPLYLLTQSALAEDTLSQTDNGFILMSAMLVLLMSIPGIGLFYSGLTRAKNVLSTIEQTLAVFCIAILLWFAVGYSIAFGGTDGALGNFFGELSKSFLAKITPDSLSGSISELTFVIFQGAFCAIASCLVVGATVERVKFTAVLIALSIWIVLSYAPLAHQVWGGGFIDTVFMSYDFAGGTVVHINAAVCGITGAFMLGRRNDLGKVVMTPHNLGFTYIGACLLWIGWLGFNAGSELCADGVSALAFINTVLCPAAAALTWMICEWIIFKKPSTLGTASGVIAGLVGITPACAFVSPAGAIVIGIACGIICLWGVHGFKRLLKIDDSLDVFGIHGLGAICGGILTGVFCAPELGGAGFKGEWTSILGQTYGQTVSILISIVWSFVASVIAFYVAKKLVGLRVSSDEESEGLDLASHGERGYNL